MADLSYDHPGDALGEASSSLSALVFLLSASQDICGLRASEIADLLQLVLCRIKKAEKLLADSQSTA